MSWLLVWNQHLFIYCLNLFSPSKQSTLPENVKPDSYCWTHILKVVLFVFQRDSTLCWRFRKQVPSLLTEDVTCYCLCYADERRRGVTTASLSICLRLCEHIGVGWSFVVVRWPVNHRMEDRVCMCGLATQRPVPCVTGVNYQSVASVYVWFLNRQTDRSADDKQWVVVLGLGTQSPDKI